jgi:hypothetical protein
MGGGSEIEDSEVFDAYEIDLEDICGGCGVESSAWKGNQGKGYIKNGCLYCCRDCADDIECTCGMSM